MCLFKVKVYVSGQLWEYKEDKKMIIPPPCQYEALLKLYHDDQGHPGIGKTFKKVIVKDISNAWNTNQLPTF